MCAVTKQIRPRLDLDDSYLSLYEGCGLCSLSTFGSGSIGESPRLTDHSAYFRLTTFKMSALFCRRRDRS
jgi:hypothetical protein